MATFLPTTDPSQSIQLEDSQEQSDEPDCDAVFTEYIVFEIGIISCLYVILAGTIIINRFKFSHVALVSTPGYPKSLRIKTVAQIFMVGLLLASLGLSFLDTSYWVKSCNNPLFGLLYLIHIGVLVLNIDWMKFQFERKIPLLWYQNQLFWGLLSVFYLFALILCYFINSSGRYDAPDFYIVILKVINSIFLTAYTIRKRQDLADFMGDSGLKSRLIQKQKQLETQKRRIAQDERDSAKKKAGSNNQRHSVDEKRPELKVTVINKIQRREDEQTGKIEVLYKLHVIIGPCDYKISHNLSSFRSLGVSLLTEEPENDAYIAATDNLNATLSDPDVENMSNFTFVVLNLQNFFNTILKSLKISDSLITFLKVPEEGVQHLQGPIIEKRDTIEVPEEINTAKNPLVFIKNDENEEEEKKDSQDGIKLSRRETLEIKKASEQDYFPYFVVTVPSYRKAAKGDYIEFMITLQLTEKLDEGWQVFKRYSDFVHIKQQLKDLLNVSPPKLPTKFIVTSDEDQMEDRRKKLENWMRIVLNEKLYFTPQLFEFVGLNPSYYEWLQDEETFDFSHFKAKIDKNHILMNNSKPYTVYHIIIEEKRDGDSRLKKRVYTLYRRFKEFYELQKALQTRFAKSMVKLPELPPKYTTFSNKTTTDFRQEGLETYLNQLFGFPNIGDSFAFRKFINFKRVVDSFITGKESTEQVIASSYEPEPQNISNETIDKMLSTARNKKNQE